MLGLIAMMRCVKYEASPTGIDALRQRGMALETGQPPSIPGVNAEALRRSW